MQAIELRRVRFNCHHQGMGATFGDVLDVEAAWAEKALAAGIVEEVKPTTESQRPQRETPSETPSEN